MPSWMIATRKSRIMPGALAHADVRLRGSTAGRGGQGFHGRAFAVYKIPSPRGIL